MKCPECIEWGVIESPPLYPGDPFSFYCANCGWERKVHESEMETTTLSDILKPGGGS